MIGRLWSVLGPVWVTPGTYREAVKMPAAPGSTLTRSAVSTDCCRVLTMSISGAAEVTVTDSLSSPTGRVTSTDAANAPTSRTSSRTTVLNPASSKVTV